MRAVHFIFGFFAFGFLLFSSAGCGGTEDDTDTSIQETKRIQKSFPAFGGDTAYTYIQKQLSFGPRIPGTPGQKLCAEWLRQELMKYCDTVYFQQANTKTAEGKTIPIYNIIGSFKPQAKQRMLLASHWDSRPWADEDIKDQDKPIPAANDGASGVGVLLELAANLKKTPPLTGIDIIFFDAEDLGKPDQPNSYCLGSQYWSLNPHIPDYKANGGVLLDMVGGKDAQFFYEGYSYQNAENLLSHTWRIAAELGYGAQFVPQTINSITDDHVYVTLNTKIPMIDIIQHDPQTRSFGHYWHTHADNMDAVDKKTLKMVGNVVTALVFNPPFEVWQ
jgi:glutaminyl-peptide cyclotransferase